MFEKKHQPLAPRSIFILRIITSVLFGIFLVVLTLSMGICGLMFFENMNYVDAFSNAALILASVGAITSIVSNAGKVFCGYYAIFSSFIYIIVIGIIFAPVVHRLFHKFHLDS